MANDESVTRDGDSYHHFVAAAFVVVSVRCVNRHLTVGDSVVKMTQRFNMVYDVSLKGGGPIDVVEVNA
jgi:hypothetical protein